MDRRSVIAALGALGAIGAWPLAARAQQPGKLPTIGVLGTPAAPIWKSRMAAFVQRLGELGWVEGRTVKIEYRWAQGHNERFGGIAAEFVREKVDVILTSGAAVTAVKKVTSSVPVVFAIDADPVGSGHVASLARPGGNATGLSLQGPDVAGKRLEMAREIIPGLRRVAILGNVANRTTAREVAQVEAGAARLGLTAARLDIRSAEDIDKVFAAFKDGADVLYICGFDPLVNTQRARIHALATAGRMPTVSGDEAYVKAGGLLSYGPNFEDAFQRAADFVDKILRGAKPGDLPVEQPTKFDLALNLKTARTFGLTMPPTLLAVANQVIE
jgi:putative ABC transport system substrate-binding protein